MAREIDVTVIVPVFNVEKYLRKCLDSLVIQTLKTIEVIVVNDGSTDGSQAIIDEYVKKYPEIIKAFTKKNGGLGDARNYGINKARGKYIGFVDSDDWVDPKMFKAMFEMTKEGNDIVVCDMVAVQDGWEKGQVSKGFRGTYPTKEEFIINSTDPAVACNKLFDKKFFKLINFSSQWYEDVGTTPVLLSYANKIGYLEIPLYYYRQRQNSITRSEGPKTLGVIKSWQRILENINLQYKSEAVFAVCKSIAAFIQFKPAFADDFLLFAKKNEELIKKNHYYEEAVKNNTLIDILNKELIPKKVHYFWFGGGEKSELVNKCIKSWRKYAQGYEIIEWNESNCDIEENEYVKEAYKARKWAFVADYFRIKVLYEHGGIYVDTDTELTNNIDSLRIHNAFFAFETRDAVHAGILGAVPNNTLIKKWLDTYKNNKFKTKDGQYNTANTIVKRLTKLLKEDYNIVMNGSSQLLEGNIMIYSPNILTIDTYDGRNIAVHHYDASWWDVKDEISYKHIVLRDYFGDNILPQEDSNIDHLQNNINNLQNNINHLQNEINKYRDLVRTYENTISWRITLPLRKIRALVRKKV